jgi:hypothetical protein
MGNDSIAKLRSESASEQEKVDALFALQVLPRAEIPRELIQNLATDPAAEVRYYTLHTLILDLEYKDNISAELCWRVLQNDPDEDVRGMAAACLGSIYFGSRRRDLFERLRAQFEESVNYPGVKWAIFDAMRALVGLPPETWKIPREMLLSQGPDPERLNEVEKALESGDS